MSVTLTNLFSWYFYFCSTSVTSYDTYSDNGNDNNKDYDDKPTAAKHLGEYKTYGNFQGNLFTGGRFNVCIGGSCVVDRVNVSLVIPNK